MLSAWSLLPEDLAALGHRGDAAHLYGRIMRNWTWIGGAPDVGREARTLLERHVDFSLPRIVAAAPSADGATKALVALDDGARIETVHMPRAVKRPRVTLCLSSQVGCAMACTFCATASMGLVRDLSPHEIVGQVLAMMQRFGPARADAVTLVFMGMGEPLHNVDALVRAIRILCHPAGLAIPKSRITVSTAGRVPGIDRLAREEQRPLLAVSLNATTDAARARTMPITRAWGLADLRAALARWPLRPHEKVTIEYVLMAGENDTPEDADRLREWVGSLRHLVNVIPMNEHAASTAREPAEARLQAFVRRLQERGCLVTVRRSRGRDVGGACGVLATGRPSLKIVRAGTPHG